MSRGIPVFKFLLATLLLAAFEPAIAFRATFSFWVRPTDVLGTLAAEWTTPGSYTWVVTCSPVTIVAYGAGGGAGDDGNSPDEGAGGGGGFEGNGGASTYGGGGGGEEDSNGGNSQYGGAGGRGDGGACGTSTNGGACSAAHGGGGGGIGSTVFLGSTGSMSGGAAAKGGPGQGGAASTVSAGGNGRVAVYCP